MAPDLFELFGPGDEALPKEVTQSLSGYVTDHPFTSFAFGLTQDQVRKQEPYKTGLTRPLKGIPGFEDPAVSAKALVDAFASLPWQYQFVFALPFKTFSSGETEVDYAFRLGERVSLVRPGANFRAEHPIPPTPEALDELLLSLYRGRPREWSSENLYLVYLCDGYVTDSFDTQPVRDTRLIIRATGGLSIRAVWHVELRKNTANSIGSSDICVSTYRQWPYPDGITPA